MAIKDQCNNCKLFDGNICRAHNTLPNYNQTSCEGYSKKGINLDKKRRFLDYVGFCLPSAERK